MINQKILCFNYKYFIQKDLENKLIEYKYKGGTDSLLNTYFWSPLA